MTSMNFRVDDDTKQRYLKAADDLSMTLTDWVKMACDAELRKMEPRGRHVTVVQVREKRRTVEARFCSHPPQVRSDTAPDGSSRCMMCDSVFRRLP